MVSPAVRAVQTWDVAWEAMKEHAPQPQIELVPELYGADATQLLLSIRQAAATDPKQLMLVGHNPGMHELALALIGSGDQPRGRRCRTICRPRGLPCSTLRPTTGTTWHSAAAGWCCSSARSC